MSLGLERAGMEPVWFVEIDLFCQTVLAKHWPNVPIFDDVHDVGAHNLEPVDLICGGFPCQPVSQAGQKKAQEDDRWLWPEFARIIRELRPHYILVENVPGLLARGMGDVLRDLAAIGYDAEWESIPASAVGAPHRRDRVFLLAHTSVEGLEGTRMDRRPTKHGSALADSDREVGPSPWGASKKVFQPRTLERPRRCGSGCGGPWAVEPDVGRVADGVPDRVDQLRALGNAVVPQVAEWIGRRVLKGFLTEGKSDV